MAFQLQEIKDLSFGLFAKTSDYFNLEFSIDGSTENNKVLSIELSLNNGSYIISPNSNDNFYGPLTIFHSPGDNYIVKPELIEIPSSHPEMDTLINSFVNFVRVNTKYQQIIEIKNTEDFVTRGILEFVLEPSCIPYDVEFEIEQRNGLLTVTKLDTKVSEEFRQ